jgi:predicted outer membrane repeat protein
LNITSSQSNIEFRNVSFKNNISLNANGGAIYMGSFAYNITISFDNCNFTGNQANTAPTIALGYGGALMCNNGTTAKTFNFTNCNFKNNTAYGRGGALYFSSVITCNITDCVFDSNFCTNATDNTSSGGCVYVAGGTSSNTFTINKTIFINSSCTAKGSVFWFNTLPKNYLNLTNCSLLGNYAKRTTSARSAIDADNFTTNLDVTLNKCLLSNYNNNASGVKQSNCADLQNLSNTPTVLNANTTTFTNSILNGVYFSSSNALDATSPSLLYLNTGYLADSTINLALSGDLKVTDKIAFNKVFTSANVGTYTHAQIFDVKSKLNIPMTLVATIPTGYKLTVDGTDYSAGLKTITIAASASSPAISLSVDTSTGINRAQNNFANISASNGKLLINDLKAGDNIAIYNAAGQLLNIQSAKSNTMSIDAKGFVIVKINSGDHNQVTKLIVR